LVENWVDPTAESLVENSAVKKAGSLVGMRVVWMAGQKAES
jgi:hypothetical protein